MLCNELLFGSHNRVTDQLSPLESLGIDCIPNRIVIEGTIHHRWTGAPWCSWRSAVQMSSLGFFLLLGATANWQPHLCTSLTCRSLIALCCTPCIGLLYESCQIGLLILLFTSHAFWLLSYSIVIKLLYYFKVSNFFFADGHTVYQQNGWFPCDASYCETPNDANFVMVLAKNQFGRLFVRTRHLVFIIDRWKELICKCILWYALNIDTRKCEILHYLAVKLMRVLVIFLIWLVNRI